MFRLIFRRPRMNPVDLRPYTISEPLHTLGWLSGVMISNPKHPITAVDNDVKWRVDTGVKPISRAVTRMLES